MNTIFKKSVLNIAVVSALTVFATSAAMAVDTTDPANTSQEVGGTIAQINSTTFVTEGIAGEFLATDNVSDRVFVKGVVESNLVNGWKMTIASANNGVLEGENGNSITYQHLKLIPDGTGTLGTGLTVTETYVDVSLADAVFNTGGFEGKATTSTVGYGFGIAASWDGDSSRLEGTYTDSLTVTMAEDV